MIILKIDISMKPMEHHHDPTWPIATIVSMLSAVMAWISLQNSQIILALIATGVSIVCGVLAARYYWFAAKEKKLTIKNMEKDDKD